MKFKHVFLSSLLVSTAFVACTNEDFAEISTPANTKDAIALGEGFTITGAKAGSDVDTRAIFTDNLDGTLWEKTDVLGAAWYNMITGFNEDGTVSGVASAFNKKFASNIWFKWSEQVGADMSKATFKSDANAMAGAYVLYFPYNPEWTTAADEIPVKISNLQTMDCTAGKEMTELNKNIFAYSVYPFVPGGSQTGNFELKQVQNVFKINFQVEKTDLMVLEKPVKIAKVIVEAKASASVLRSEGKVIPPTATVNAASYNENKLGKAVYEASATTVDHLILTVENATDDYSIQAVKTPTKKPFYLSTLPFSGDASSVTFKILTTDGKVYSKEYTAGKVLDAINTRATEEGKLVAITVTLENLSDEGTVYTAEQFKTQWDAALTASEAKTLKLGEGVDLSDVDLKVANAGADITIDGKSVKVKSLTISNGKLNIKNELEVIGDVIIGANSKGFKTEATGKLSIGGEFNVEGATSDVAIAQMKSLNIAAAGVITITGPADKAKSGVIVNEGKLTLKTFNINTLTNAGSGTLTLGDVNVVNDGTVTNNGLFALSTFDFANNGTFYQNDVVSGTGEFNNNAGATLEITATATEMKITNAAKDADKKLAAGVINITGASDAKAAAVTTDNSCTLTNNGIINVNAHATLTESANGAIVQTDADARINLTKDATLALENTAALAQGYIVADKDATITNDATSEPIASIVTKDADLVSATSTIHANAATLFVKGDLTVTSANEATLKAKNLVLFNNLTLENNLEMTSTNAVIVAGTVKISATEAKAFTLISTGNKVNEGASLTIGENVTLSGAASSTLSVKGSIVNQGTITAAGSTNLTISY